MSYLSWGLLYVWRLISDNRSGLVVPLKTIPNAKMCNPKNPSSLISFKHDCTDFPRAKSPERRHLSWSGGQSLSISVLNTASLHSWQICWLTSSGGATKTSSERSGSARVCVHRPILNSVFSIFTLKLCLLRVYKNVLFFRILLFCMILKVNFGYTGYRFFSWYTTYSHDRPWR